MDVRENETDEFAKGSSMSYLKTKYKNYKPRKDKFIAMSHFSRLLHKIDFTTEQKNKIAEIMQNNKASMSEKYKDLHNLYKQFDDIKFNQNFDSNKAQNLVKQISEKRIEIDLEDFNIEKQIYDSYIDSLENGRISPNISFRQFMESEMAHLKQSNICNLFEDALLNNGGIMLGDVPDFNSI